MNKRSCQNTLIVGAGFLGMSMAEHLSSVGHNVVVASRNPIASKQPWLRLDVSNPNDWHDVVASVQPQTVVLTHGPSDVTGCERSPEVAAKIHRQAVEFAHDFATDAYSILISTDNVFSGKDPVSFEADKVDPPNAYGRAKLAAEHVQQERGGLILRVSVLYGWEMQRPGRSPNFFVQVHHRLASGREFVAPTDHWNTPVLVNDLSLVVQACMDQRQDGLLHLGGPQRLSRYEWAQCIAQCMSVSEHLVVGAPKSETNYACRPDNGGLASSVLEDFFDVSTLRDVEAGTRYLLNVY